MCEPIVHEVEYVAELLAQTPEFIRSQCRAQKIRAVKVGKRWLIPQDEINRLLNVEPTSTSTRSELVITKLEAQNRELKSQLAAVKSFLTGATEVLGISK